MLLFPNEFMAEKYRLCLIYRLKRRDRGGICAEKNSEMTTSTPSAFSCFTQKYDFGVVCLVDAFIEF